MGRDGAVVRAVEPDEHVGIVVIVHIHGSEAEQHLKRAACGSDAAGERFACVGCAAGGDDGVGVQRGKLQRCTRGKRCAVSAVDGQIHAHARTVPDVQTCVVEVERDLRRLEKADGIGCIKALPECGGIRHLHVVKPGKKRIKRCLRADEVQSVLRVACTVERFGKLGRDARGLFVSRADACTGDVRGNVQPAGVNAHTVGCKREAAALFHMQACRVGAGKLCRLLAKCCAFAVKREHRRKRLLGKGSLTGRLCHRTKTRKIAVCQRCAEFLGGFFGRVFPGEPPERQTAACKNRCTQGGGKDAALAAFRLHGRSGAGRINLDIVLRRFAADRAGIEASRNLRAAFRTNTRHKNLPSISI